MLYLCMSLDIALTFTPVAMWRGVHVIDPPSRSTRLTRRISIKIRCWNGNEWAPIYYNTSVNGPARYRYVCGFWTARPQEVVVQQSTACGARSGRRGQLAALGQLTRQFSLDLQGSNSNQRVQHEHLRAWISYRGIFKYLVHVLGLVVASFVRY